MTTMDASSSDKTIPEVPRNLLILKKLKELDAKNKSRSTPQPVQDVNKEAESVEEKSQSKTVSKVDERVEKEFEPTSNQSIKFKDAAAESDSKEKFEKLQKHKTAERIRTSSLSSSDIDCSQDTTVALMRRAKLQEFLFKNICDKNPRPPSHDNDSSSNFSDLERSPTSDGRSSNRSNVRYRRHRYNNDEDDECVPTEGLLHLKKPCIDEKNHSLYYDNHGRMEPIDWDTVIDKSKLDEEKKNKPKTSKNKVVMGPAEAFLTKDAHLLEPIPEFSNAVEDSLNEDTTFKPTDNLQRVKNSRDFSPLLKIDRAVKKSHPESLKIPADVKKRLKSSNKKSTGSKRHLIDKTNIPSITQENKIKTDTTVSDKTENNLQKLTNNELSSVVTESSAELKPTKTISASTKKNEACVDESERKEVCAQEDKENFQSDKPKPQANPAGNKKFNNQNKNKKYSDSNTNEVKTNQGRFNKNKFPRKENSETNTKFEHNDARKNKVFFDDKRRKEDFNCKNQFERSKPQGGNVSVGKKLDEFHKSRKTASQLNKLRNLNAVDSDDASSSVSEASCNLVSDRHGAFKKIKQLHTKYLTKISQDVCSEKPETTPITATTNAVEEEEEFLLKESCTRYFNKPVDSSKDRNHTPEKETLITEVKTKDFNEEFKNELPDKISTKDSEFKAEKNATDVSKNTEVLIEVINSSRITEKAEVIKSDLTILASEENKVSTKNKYEETLNILNQSCKSNKNSDTENDKEYKESSTAQTEDTSELQKSVEKTNELGQVSLEKKTVSAPNSEEKSCLKNSEQPSESNNNNFNNEITSAHNSAELTVEKEDVKIKTTAQNIYDSLHIIDTGEEILESGIEKSDDKLHSSEDIKENLDDCNNQSNSTKKELGKLEEKTETTEKHIIENERLSSEYNDNDEDVEEIIICDLVEPEKESSVVIEEIDDDDDSENKENSPSTVNAKKSGDEKIQSQSALNNDSENIENSTLPKKSSDNTSQNHINYDENCMEIDGFECVNVDQFGPFAALFGTLKSLKQAGNEISQDFKYPAIEMNGIAERNGLKSFEDSHDVSTNNNHSGTDASVSSNLESDEETMSDSTESSKPVKTEDNIFSSVNVDEIYLDNCSLNQSIGDPYYGHLLIKEPKNNSKTTGRMIKMTNALKNYKNKENLMNGEDKNEIQASTMSDATKKRLNILNEIKKRQLHLSCKPLPDKNLQ